MTLEERLAKRFRNVGGVTPEDVTDWISEAEAESGLTAGESTKTDNALLYLAYSIGCLAIATEAARFFSYKDAEESVDKTMIAAQYMALAKDARKEYAKQLRGGYASQTNPGRADAR